MSYNSIQSFFRKTVDSAKRVKVGAGCGPFSDLGVGFLGAPGTSGN
jgi:hypothetical protein